MRLTNYIIIGIVALVLVLGVHVAYAYVSWSPVITPTYATSIVSRVYGNFSWSTAAPINPTSSNPLTLYLPANMWLGSYADGYYYASLNITVQVYNPTSSSESTIVYVSCPSPLGTQSQSVTVSANSSLNVEFMFAPNLEGTVGSISQAIECNIYTSTGANITSVYIQVPVPITNWGIDTPGTNYVPAFNLTFYYPYVVYQGSTTYTTVYMIAFAGLSMNAQLSVPQETKYGTQSSGSDTSSFYATTTSGSLASFEFLITSLPYQASTPYGYYIFPPNLGYYSLVPIVFPFSNTYGSNTFLMGPVAPTYINQNSGASMTTLYVSPNGITIVPYGTVYNVYTNATNWFTYTVLGQPAGATQWFSYTGIAFPVPASSSMKFWAIAFVGDSLHYGSNLPVPELFMFNVINVGYNVNTSPFAYVNGSLATPLPKGMELLLSVTKYSNYTLANFTVTTPLLNVTNMFHIVGGYAYAPNGFTGVSNVLIEPSYTMSYQYYTTTAYSSNEEAFVTWTNVGVNTTSTSPYIGAFRARFLNNYQIVHNYLTPMVNLTVTTSGSTPTLSVGLSLTVVNVTMGKYNGAVVIMSNKMGACLSIPTKSYCGTNSYLSAFGFREYVSNHMLQYFVNTTWNKFMLIAYPWGYINASVINLYPNGTYSIVGYKLVPVYAPTRSINETVASYYVSGTYVNDLILTMSQTSQVMVIKNNKVIPAIVYVKSYSMNMSRAYNVTTSTSGYTYMGYAIPQPITYTFGSTNQGFTVITVHRYMPGTLYVIPMIDPVYNYTIPSNISDDPIINVILPTPPSTSQPPSGVVPPNAPPDTPACQMINALSISPYNITAYVNQGFTITVTLSLNSIPQQPIDYYVNVSIINSTTLVSSTILPIYAWGTETVFSNSTTLTAPPYPGGYVITASICGINATDPLTVVSTTTATRGASTSTSTNSTSGTSSSGSASFGGQSSNSTSTSGSSSSSSSSTSGQSTSGASGYCEPCTAMLHCWLFWLLLILLLIAIGWWIYKKKTEVVIKL